MATAIITIASGGSPVDPKLLLTSSQSLPSGGITARQWRWDNPETGTLLGTGEDLEVYHTTIAGSLEAPYRGLIFLRVWEGAAFDTTAYYVDIDGATEIISTTTAHPGEDPPDPDGGYPTMDFLGPPKISVNNSNGDFIVAWLTQLKADIPGSDPIQYQRNPAHLYAQIFDKDGNIKVGTFRLDDSESLAPDHTSFNTTIDVDMNETGDFVAVWLGYGSASGWHTEYGDGYGVWARQFEANGTAKGQSNRVTYHKGPPSYRNPRVALRPDGGFAVVFRQYFNEQLSTEPPNTIRIRVFNKFGHPISQPRRASNWAEHANWDPSIMGFESDDNGEFGLGLMSINYPQQIVGQRLDADGISKSVFTVEGGSHQKVTGAMGGDKDGNTIFVWKPSGTGNWLVQRMNANGTWGAAQQVVPFAWRSGNPPYQDTWDPQIAVSKDGRYAVMGRSWGGPGNFSLSVIKLYNANGSEYRDPSSNLVVSWVTLNNDPTYNPTGAVGAWYEDRLYTVWGEGGRWVFRITDTNNVASPAATWNKPVVAKISQTSAFSAWGAWTYRKEIRIDNTYATEELTDFPLFVPIEDDIQLAAGAKANGEDIRFLLQDGTPLSYERQEYSVTPSGAQGVFWVKIPTISSIDDTSIYMIYGNTFAADGANPTNVWDDDFVGVWHFSEGLGSVVADSTGNNNHGVLNTVSNWITDGTGVSPNSYVRFVKTLPYDPETTVTIAAPVTNLPTIGDSFSFTCFVRPTDYDNQGIYNYGSKASNEYNSLAISTATAYYPQGVIWYWWGNDIGQSGAGDISGLDDGDWHCIQCRYDADDPADSRTVRVDDVLLMTDTPTSASGWDNTTDLVIGQSNAWFFDGDMDEIRMSSVFRSQAWASFEYHNLRSSTNEINISSEELIGGLYVSPLVDPSTSLSSTESTGNIVERQWWVDNSWPNNLTGFPDAYSTGRGYYLWSDCVGYQIGTGNTQNVGWLTLAKAWHSDSYARVYLKVRDSNNNWDYDSLIIDQMLDGRVNTTIEGDQSDPKIAMSPVTGNYVIAWMSATPNVGIYAQRFWANGTMRGGEILIDDSEVNRARFRDMNITMDNDDNFWVAWATGVEVYFRRYTSGGVPTGAKIPVTVGAGSFSNVAIDCHPVSGRIVIGYSRYYYIAGSTRRIIIRAYSALDIPLSGEVWVSTNTGYATNLDIAMFYGVDGRFIVVWYDEQTYKVYARLYSPTVTPEGNAFGVSQNNAPVTKVFEPSVATGRGPAADGSYVIVYYWRTEPELSGSYGVKFRHYSPSSGWTNEVRVNTFRPSSQLYSDVGMGENGEFMVIWSSFGQKGLSLYQTYGKIYNPNLSLWVDVHSGLSVPEFRISQWTEDPAIYPCVAVDNDCNFAAAWVRTDDIYWKLGAVGSSGPTANADGPYVVQWNDNIQFNGTGSNSPGATIDTYSWSINGTEVATGSQPIINYSTFRNTPYDLSNGVYTLTLTITDSNGQSAVDTTTLTLLNTDPVADAGGTYTVDSGDSVGLDGSASYDPDNNPGPDGIEYYYWYISAAGNPLTVVYEVTTATNTDSTPSVSYTDLENAGLTGVLNLTLRVRDADNGYGYDTTTLTMVDLTLISKVHIHYPTSGSGYNDDYYAKAVYGNVLLGTASRELFWIDTSVDTYEINGSASAQGGPFNIEYYYFYVDMGGGVLLDLSSPGNTNPVIHVTYQQLYNLYRAEYGQPIPAGTYQVGLRVRNDNNPVDQDISVTDLYVENSVPIASVGGPYDVSYQGQVVLNGSGSYDPDFAPFGSYVGGVPTDGIETYSWRIDNGVGPHNETTGTEIATGRSPTITWQNLETAGFANGNHSLFLWVYDGAAWSTAESSVLLAKLYGVGSFYFDDTNSEGLYRDYTDVPNMFTTLDPNNYVVAGWFKSGTDVPGDRGLFSFKEFGSDRRDEIGINGTTLYWRTYDAAGTLLATANCNWPLPFDGLACDGATNASRGWHHFYCEVRKRASQFGPPSVGRWAWVMVDGQFGNKGWTGLDETLDHDYEKVTVGVAIDGSDHKSAEGWLSEVCLWQLDDVPDGYVGTPNVGSPIDGFEPPWPDLGNPDTGPPAIPDNDEIDFAALASGTCPRDVRPDKIKAFWPLTISDDYADHWNDYDLDCVEVLSTPRCPSWTSCQNVTDCPIIDPPKQPPIAVHNGSVGGLPVYEVSRNGSVTFTAVGSYDPDGGDLSEIYWYYYDGTDHPLGVGRDVTIDYDTIFALTGGVGTFGAADGDGYQNPCIGLRVSDDDDPMEQGYAYTTITVLPNNAPVAVANGDYYVYKNQRVRAIGYVSGDPTGFSPYGTADADWDSLTVLWEIHDGSQWQTLSNTVYDPTNWNPQTYLNIPNSQHDWDELVNTIGLAPDADYNVRLTIDDGIDSNTDTATLHIYPNQAPVAEAGPNSALVQGQTLNLDASGSSDADIGAYPSRPTGDLLTYLWEIYDITGSNLEVTLTDIAAVNETASFTFDELLALGLTSSTWTVRVTVWDDGDSYIPYTSATALTTQLFDSDSFLLSMDNICPVADGGGPYIVSKDSGVALAKGSPFQFTVTAGMRDQHNTFGTLCQSINNNVGGPGVFHITAGDEDTTVGDNRNVIDANFGPTFPWYPVIGHAEASDRAVDILWLEDEYNTGNGARDPLKDSTNQDGPAGTVELMYSFDYGNALFVVLNEYWEGSASDPVPPVDPEDADVVAELRTWLQGVLQASNQPYKFVIGHEAAFPDPNVPPSVGWLTGWTYRKEITIQSTYVDANLTDFPVYVPVIADADLGAYARSDGADVRFTQSDGDTLLEAEMEDYSVTTGLATGWFWVKMPIIASSIGATFYIYYGKSDETTPVGSTSTWNANYAAVWHMNSSGAAMFQITDSTANPADGNNSGTSDMVGQINRARNFPGSFDNYIWVGDTTNHKLDFLGDFTFDAWLKPDGYGGGNSQFLSKESYLTQGNATYGYTWGTHTTGKIYLVIYDGTYHQYDTVPSTVSLGSWNHYAVVKEGTTTQHYKNGEPVSAGTTAMAMPATQANNDYPFRIGRFSHIGSPTNKYYYDGGMDELRTSNVARSSAWIKFQYRNMSEADNELEWGPGELTGSAGSQLDRYLANRNAFWQILEDERVIAYICGHTRIYLQTRVAIATDHSTVQQLDVGNAGNDNSGAYPQTYFHVTVDDDGVTADVYSNGASGASIYSLLEPLDLAVGFDGRRSYDADSDALTYRWEIDSIPTSDAPIVMGTGSTLQKTYEEMAAYFGFGIHQITLFVNDNFCTTSYQTTIEILGHYDYVPTPFIRFPLVDPDNGGDLYIEEGSALAEILGTHYIYVPTPREVDPGEGGDLYIENGSALAAVIHYIYIPTPREVDPGEGGDLYIENGSALITFVHYIYIPGTTEDDPGGDDDALHINGFALYPRRYTYTPPDPGDTEYPCTYPDA